MTHLRRAAACLLALLAAAAAGCQSGPPDVSREVDVGLKNDVAYSATVDLVGLDRAEVPAWADLDLDAYWAGEGEAGASRQQLLREGRLVPVSLTSELRRRVIAKGDPLWDRWSAAGVDTLVTLVDLPSRLGEVRTGEEDPRRRIFVIDPREDAKAGDRITLRAGQDGFDVLAR